MNLTSGPGTTPNQAGEPVAGPMVFISHASQDHVVAEEICRLLEEDGIRCWIAPRNVDPGHDYAEQILAGIASTRVMVLLLSSHANASGFVKSEVERAISKGKVVIPLRIEEVQPSGSLELFVSRSQWIDAWAPPLHSRVHVLAAAIRGLLALPPLQDDRARAGIETVSSQASLRRSSGHRRLVAGLGIAGAVAALAVVDILGSLLLTGHGGTAASAPPARGASGQFVATGSMSGARGWPNVVALRSGLVLVMGGWDNVGAVGTAELYDPTTGKFRPTGSMGGPRGLATTTLLDDGRVLVAGGQDENVTFLKSTEIYNPETGLFSSTGSMAVARNGATATKIASGRVLIAGGWDSHSEITASAEVYDPATGTFTPTGSMTSARAGHFAALLPDGSVLIAGGQDGSNVLDSAEIYDPAGGDFHRIGSLNAARSDAPAVVLASGRVLVVGGDAGGAYGSLKSAEVYDPTSGMFSLTSPMSVPRQGPAFCTLADGRVLIAGGKDDSNRTLSSAEVFDPASGSFGPTGSMTSARHWPVAAALQDGSVLILGGETASGNVASAELYRP